MTRKAAINTIVVLLVAILGVISYKLSPLLRVSANISLPVSTCDPNRQDCSVTLPEGGTVELSFKPRPVRPLQAFKVELTLSGVETQKVEIDFEGTGMKMGYNRPELTGSNGVYSGNVILPVCITGTMEWAATVLLSTPSGQIAIPFHFEVAGR